MHTKRCPQIGHSFSILKYDFYVKLLFLSTEYILQKEKNEEKIPAPLKGIYLWIISALFLYFVTIIQS